MSVKITGIEDVNRILGDLAPKEARNLMRVVSFDIAKQAAAMVRERTPVDTGELRAAVKHVRTREGKDKPGAAVVFRGRKANSSHPAGYAFYWRILEFGDGPDGVEHAMVTKTIEALRPDMPKIYVEAFARKLIARLKRERKRVG